MSNRGRGRGGGLGGTNSDRSASSSAASSRSSSLTNLSATNSTTTTKSGLDADQLMKQLSNKAKVGVSGLVGPGAAKVTPKSFKPNLSAAKKEKTTVEPTTSNVSTGKNAKSSASPMNKKRDQISQRSNSGRKDSAGFNRSRGNVVQLEGIFQANAQNFHSSNSSGASRSNSSIKRESSSSNSLRIPNVKRLGTEHFSSIGSADGFEYQIDEEYQPRQIPIGEKKSIFQVKKEIDFSTKIKETPMEEKNDQLDSFVRLFSQQQIETRSKNSIVKDEPMEIGELEKSSTDQQISTNEKDSSNLVLIQFPDVLPFVRPSSSADKPELASLSDLPDGFLGKLQIFKSGRCRLKLNDQTFLDVDIGQSTSFLQNVMVTEMTSNPSNQTANNNDINKLVCLGDIKHKLVVSLDVDHVLKDTRQ